MEALKFAPGVEGLIKPLHPFLHDGAVSEILINRPQEIFVEKDGVMLHFEMPQLTSQYLRRLFLLIANENTQCLSEECPILSGNLYDGSRVQLVIPPASMYGTLSIRKFKLKSLSLEAFAEQRHSEPSQENEESPANLKELGQEKNWPLFLKSAIENRKNIIISGATNSGKTTFLNSCLNLIPEHERIITIEDTYEINVNRQNMVRLKAIKHVGSNNPLISMQDLVQASLRLRPDRIIMGEIRGKEIFDFISASSTGHPGALATIHATNPRVAFMRMAQLYKLNNVSGIGHDDIIKELHEVIDIVVQLHNKKLIEIYFKDVA